MTEGAAKILASLLAAPDEAHSGETLSSLLGVSRNQVWKHIEALRELGYTIEGVAGGGYQLLACPDRLHAAQIAPGLHTQWLARHYHYFSEVDSTNRIAFEMAREGAPHGTTVVAETQTQGRGRLQRSFFSPAYENLYTSIVLRPAMTLDRAATSVLAAAVAVAEAINTTMCQVSASTATVQASDAPASSRPLDAQRTLGASSKRGNADVSIKWPNDVLLGGLKAAGILMELQAEATRVGFLILGIGVNLNTPRESFPDEFRARTTSLAAHAQKKIDRVRFAQDLYNTLEEIFELHFEFGFPVIRSRFDALCRMPGQPVTISNPHEGDIVGTVQKITDDGALVVQTDAGKLVRVLAGDVRVRQA